MKKFLKAFFAIIGAVILIDGVALFFVSNFNLGNFLTVLLGGMIILLCLKFDELARWFKILLVAGISVGVISASFLIVFGTNDDVTYKEDAVIVLGAAVHGKTPSLTLKRRLDVAVDYHKQNPDALIVVSGGKGPQEEISEAEAMQIYLIDKGVDADKIILEAAATSTYENFKFSKQILEEEFGEDYTVCFITNEFHILRSILFAKQTGIENISHLHANTNLSYLVSGSLRECLAVLKYIILKS